jgi:hypothetical protein
MVVQRPAMDNPQDISLLISHRHGCMGTASVNANDNTTHVFLSVLYIL